MLKVVPRLASLLPRILEESLENARRGERVATGAMPAGDLDAVVQRHMIEGAPAQLGNDLSRQLHRTEAPAAEGASRRALGLHRHEAPIEGRVMRDEHAAVEHAEELIADLGEGRSVPDHVPGDIR